MRIHQTLKLRLTGMATSLTLAASMAMASGHREAGDVLRYALPASVMAYELWEGDTEGATQFATSWAVSLGASELLKRSTRVTRPDQKDSLSFPSGHATHAFSAAAYMHRRHGWDSAWPWYVAASYVGWTRVNANRHRWSDVAGSAALSVATAWWLVTPKSDNTFTLIPSITPDGLGLYLHASW